MPTEEISKQFLQHNKQLVQLKLLLMLHQQLLLMFQLLQM
jgi:hypothetical protein